MMQSTLNRSASPFRVRLAGRIAVFAVALIGLSFMASSAEAGRKDRAGWRETRQAKLVVKRVERLEQISVRAVERAPDATIRLLDLLVTRGASPSQLEAIALRGSHKVATECRRFEDQIRKYTDGLIQRSTNVVLDDDGVIILPDEIDDVTEGTIQFLRNDLVSEDLIMEVITTRQSALNAIQDAALVSEARIQAALDAAIDALSTP